MPDFWKASVKGTAGAQEIVNVLYYVDDSTGDATFDTAAMGDLAVEIRDTVLTPIAGNLANQLNWSQIEVVLVNEYNETISPYAVELGISLNGGNSTTSETQGVVAIVGFRVGPMAEGQTVPIPKRSYVALGPITADVTDEEGLISWSSLVKEAIEGALSDTLVGGLGSYRPVRVGRRIAPADPAYGEVIDAVVRPYASFRRSRLRRPSGS